MIYVKRDINKKIIEIFTKDTEGNLEKISSIDKEVIDFLEQQKIHVEGKFLKSDLELIRVMEDLVRILIEKNIISITDFPLAAIEKLVNRNNIREEYRSLAGILSKL